MSRERAIFDTKLSDGDLDAVMSELSPRVKCLWELGAIYLVNFSLEQGSGPKWQQAVIYANETMPEVLETLKDKYSIDTVVVPHGKGIDRVSIPTVTVTTTATDTVAYSEKGEREGEAPPLLRKGSDGEARRAAEVVKLYEKTIGPAPPGLARAIKQHGCPRLVKAIEAAAGGDGQNWEAVAEQIRQLGKRGLS